MYRKDNQHYATLLLDKENMFPQLDDLYFNS